MLEQIYIQAITHYVIVYLSTFKVRFLMALRIPLAKNFPLLILSINYIGIKNQDHPAN